MQPTKSTSKKLVKPKKNAKKVARLESEDAEPKALITIDERQGLIFQSKKDLLDYFGPKVDDFELDWRKKRPADDYTREEMRKLKEELDLVLDDPDEVWMEEKKFDDLSVSFFMRQVDEHWHLAIVHVAQDDQTPTFVYFHFPTKGKEFFRSYRRGYKVYDRIFEKVIPGMIDGDALSDGDDLAVGLYLSMMKIRGEKDVAEDKFQELGNLREETLQGPDEIWRKTDMDGHVLVVFIKEFAEQEFTDLHYVAVTLEDPQSNTHSLLFTFPTNDESLLDRYRQGENLQADEVVQESSH